MRRHTMLVIAAVIATLLVTLFVAAGSGLAVTHMGQAGTRAISQRGLAPAPQQNPALLARSGTPVASGGASRSWKLVSFIYDGSPQVLVWRITAAFTLNAQELTVTGHACNAYGDAYTLSPDISHLTSHGVWQTQALCKSTSGGDVMAQETNYFAALRQITTYRFDQSSVTLRDDSGLYVLRYVPA